MSKITSSPSFGILPGSGCIPTPSPSLPSIPTNPLPGGSIGAVNKQRSSELANTQAAQLEKIQTSLQDCAISTPEATRLLEEQAKIAESIKAAQSDGFISASEHASIMRQQYTAGQSISQAANTFEFDNLFSRDDSLSQKQADHIGHIASGIRDGNLSGAEASSLLRDQANISRSLANAQADGNVSLAEKAITQFQQQRAGQDIQLQKADLEKAPHGPGADILQPSNQRFSAQVSNTQARQLEQLQRGVQNGTISSQEATRLLEKQAQISESIKAAQADGVVTLSERAGIQRQQMMVGLGTYHAGRSAEPSTGDNFLSQRQAEQIGSIARGIRSGNLTGGEASSLLKGQADIARSLTQAQADGHVDISEMVKTYFKQESAADNIQREKTDLEKAAHARRRLPTYF